MSEPLYIFLHIPKTSGTSLFESFKCHFSNNQILNLYGYRKTSKLIKLYLSNPLLNKNKINAIFGHQVWYGIHKYFPNRDCRYITFLRHPVSRVESDYWKIRRTPKNRDHDRVSNISLNEFISNPTFSFNRNLMTVYLSRTYSDSHHNKKDCLKVTDKELSLAKENLSRFYFIGFQETHDLNMNQLSKLIKIPFKTKHIFKRPTQQNITMSNLDIKLTQELNQLDLDLYSFAQSLTSNNHE